MSAFVEALLSPILLERTEPNPVQKDYSTPSSIQDQAPIEEPLILPVVCTSPPKKPMLKPKKKLLALPLGKVEMPQKEGPLQGYITPIQHW